jgi:hypothetical protein
VLCLAACRRAPRNDVRRPVPAEAAAHWVRAHASAMEANAETLRACMGGTLPADPAHAPALSRTVCECAEPLSRRAGFGECGRGANFLAFTDSSSWAALVFSPAGPPAVWPNGVEQVQFGQGLIYSTGAEPLGGPWYVLHLDPRLD